MLQSVKEDIYRYYGDSCTNLFARIKYAMLPGTRTMWLIRHYQAASCKLTRALWMILCYWDKSSTGMQVPPQTKIGRGCRFVHFGNVVIQPDTVIGDNCNIAQGVLLGSNNTKGKEGSPTIGNNCCIFANAIVLGGGKDW